MRRAERIQHAAFVNRFGRLHDLLLQIQAAGRIGHASGGEVRVDCCAGRRSRLVLDGGGIELNGDDIRSRRRRIELNGRGAAVIGNRRHDRVAIRVIDVATGLDSVALAEVTCRDRLIDGEGIAARDSSDLNPVEEHTRVNLIDLVQAIQHVFNLS